MDKEMADLSHSTWAAAWRGLRDDVNMLAWLFEEEAVMQRLYMESLFYAVTGRDFPVEEFARLVGLGAPAESPVDDSEPEERGALDEGGESQS